MSWSIRPLAIALARLLGACAAAASLLVSEAVHAAPRPPRDFMGIALGDDRVLADWRTIVAYMDHLDAESERVVVDRTGRSTQDRPILLVTIADEEGIRGREKYQQIARQLADGRGTTRERAAELAQQGRAVVAISMGVHSTEVGAPQAASEIVYQLATSEEPWAREVRANVIVLLVPSMNPDGLDIVVDWYRRTVGTPAEGSEPPWLYHPYAGHDNNRDGFFNNLAETWPWSRMLYHEWLPQVVVDEHQMGRDGPRLFLPPFDDPVSATVHPLVYSQLAACGQHMVSDLTGLGWQGIVTSAIFTAEWPGSVRSTGFWHNMLGILSEVASADLASPLYFAPGSLSGRGRGLPEYERRANFLQPWPGGWWRLRDIMDIDKDLTWSLLRWAAREKVSLLTNFHTMGHDAVATGSSQAPYGFVIPVRQHDAGAAPRLVELLRMGGVEVGFVSDRLEVEGRIHEDGAFIALSAQPFRPYLIEMLQSTDYPAIRESAEGEVVRPYDVTAWNLPALLGAQVQALQQPWAGPKPTPVTEQRRPFAAEQALLQAGAGAGSRAGRASGVRVFAGSDNASYAVALAALRAGGQAWRAREAHAGFSPGDFVIDGAEDAVADAAKRLGARVRDLTAANAAAAREHAVTLTIPRIGVYDPWGGSMDEGWMRLVLDRFGFAYQKLRAEDLRATSGKKQAPPLAQAHPLDVVVLPSIRTTALEEGTQPERPRNAYSPQWPREYRGGIGERETGDRLREFVEQGGTVVAIDESTPWVVKHLGLPARVLLDGLKPEEFSAPGTLLRAELDPQHPLAWGMPQQTAAYFAGGRAFAPIAWQRPTAAPVRYAGEDVRVAGFLLGEQHVSGQAAVLDVPLGRGRVVLFGFAPYHRAQTEATFKLFLNALLRAGERSP